MTVRVIMIMIIVMIVRLTETVSRDGAVIVQGRVLGRLGGQGRDHGGLPLHHLQRDLLHKISVENNIGKAIW